MAKEDLNPPIRETRPDWTYWANRASFHTEAEREHRYREYLESSVDYFAAVEASGDKPWWTTEAERRELFMRRYTRPEPPASIPVRTLAEIRGDNTYGKPHHQNDRLSQVA